MTGRYHVKVNGQGFLVRPSSYKKTASAGAAGMPASPARSGAWHYWEQSDWRGGDGGQEPGIGERRPETRFAAGYGLEMGEAGRVRLGPVVEPRYVTTAEDGFAAMLAMGSRLFAGSSSSGRVYSFDGSTWSLSGDTGKLSLRSLARHGNHAYLGSGSDGTVWWSEGGGWSEAFNVAGAVAVGAVASYGVWSPTLRATVLRLFVGAEYPSDEARLFCWDGSALVEVQACREARVEAMAVYDGKLYVATSDRSNGVQGRLLCFDGRSLSGEWSEVASFSDGYVAGLIVFDGLLYCGSGLGGKLWAFDGSRIAEAYSISSPGGAYTEPLSAMAVCGGRLHAGYVHPTEGVGLLCKLPAQVLGAGDWVSGNSSTQHLISSAQMGWFTPSTVDTTGLPRAMAVYGGEIYLGVEKPQLGSIYMRDSSAHRAMGLMESRHFDAGLSGVPKLLRSLTLGHEKLLAGQYLEASFTLEGTDSFQYLEQFLTMAGCDRSRTTADWRTADSTLRLKGMPLQSFQGKTSGGSGPAHVARRLLSTNPLSPPAAFTEEFSGSEYEAISQADGAFASAANPAPGGYAHLLFEFGLAGLSPVGLRPRVICYGRGDGSGAPANGAAFRIWNHVSIAWDELGSNTARAEDSLAEKTIEATIADFGRYVSGFGKLYLAVSSSHGGSPAIPAEVAADLVTLDPLWQESGEAVSESLSLPVAEQVSGAELTILSATTPPGTWIELFMSADGGKHWEAVEDGVEHSFVHPGSSLRWKVRLATANPAVTPSIDRLKVDYLTGRWIHLGRSDTEGATSAVLPFESGLAARRVSFRIEMGSADPTSSPALSSIALEYVLRPDMKRRWEMDLRCEGAMGLPLRLLDGTAEKRTGRDLSEALWQARARGVAGFEDLDGACYQVWIEELEERLSDTPQERGPQTVARCRFLEC